MILAGDSAETVTQLIAFLGHFPNLKPWRNPSDEIHMNHITKITTGPPSMAYLGHHEPPAARTKKANWLPLQRGIFCPKEKVMGPSSEARCACWH